MIDGLVVMETTRTLLITDILGLFLSAVLLLIAASVVIGRLKGIDEKFAEEVSGLFCVAIMLIIALAISDFVQVMKLEKAAEVVKGGIL